MSLLLLFAGASRVMRPPLPKRMGAAISDATPRARVSSATPEATLTDRTPTARVKRGNRSWT